MWMVGCNDGHDGFNISDSNGWRLRPLVPRPTSNTSSHPCLSRIHGSDLFPLNTNLGFITEQNKQELSVQTVVSSRWNPTPEQLRALEDLYRCGTRTPTAEQIQHITAQLRRFGKIEGKNVFYWFQNHKARERQKRRRRLESAAATKEQQLYDIESLEKKDSGSTRNGFEVERNRNCSPHTNFSTFVEESVSMQKPTVAESRAEGWIQFEEGELQQRPSSKEILATWQMMHLSSSTPSHLVNTITTATTTEPITTIDQNLMISKEISSDVFRTPNRSETLQENLYNLCSDQNNEECEDSNTLQLFPVSSDNADNHGDGAKETKLSIQKTSCDFTPYPQFFEFFPMKN